MLLDSTLNSCSASTFRLNDRAAQLNFRNVRAIQIPSCPRGRKTIHIHVHRAGADRRSARSDVLPALDIVHSRSQLRQLPKIAAIQRHALHGRRVDHLADRRGCLVQQRNLVGDDRNLFANQARCITGLMVARCAT